ncbi:MAG: flagellar hook-associated protein FlgK [Phycisphaerae bacterium]|nr:flagellar hook-associated protein FlgK [Phycisphaerae bacterium]
MGLTSALQIGRSGLVASQVGIQVAGNNMSNAATPGYTRQQLFLQPSRDQLSGSFSLGRGVGVRAVERQIDEALQARLRESISAQSFEIERRQVLDQLESIMGELSGFDLSSEMSSFFNAWSDAANLAQADAVVVERGQQLASFIRSLRNDMSLQRRQLEDQIGLRTNRADALLDEVASINAQISGSEVGGSSANGLRDRRDELLSELAGLIDIDTLEDNQGVVDVYVGGSPVVLAGQSLGVRVNRRSDGTTVTTEIVAKSDGSRLPVRGGSIGGLLASRDATIDDTIDRLDRLAQQVIFQVNRAHSTGSDQDGLTSAVGELRVATPDQTIPFNDPANATFGGLPFKAENGGFFINVFNAASGVSEQVRIDVDLDGIDANGLAGTADDTSPQDIADQINDVNGVRASFDAAGRLVIEADAGFSFAFEADTSGVLAVMGVNTFFTGETAGDIAVRADLLAQPSLLKLGKFEGDQFIENGAALDIVNLQSSAQAKLGGVSVEEFWLEAVQDVANEASAAQTRADSSELVRASLQAQRDGLSGVSIDEESINLLTFQRQFQGSSQVISVANELLNTLISII